MNSELRLAISLKQLTISEVSARMVGSFRSYAVSFRFSTFTKLTWNFFRNSFGRFLFEAGDDVSRLLRPVFGLLGLLIFYRGDVNDRQGLRAL